MSATTLQSNSRFISFARGGSLAVILLGCGLLFLDWETQQGRRPTVTARLEMKLP